MREAVAQELREGLQALRALRDARLVRPADALLAAERRIVSTGIAELDALLGGGFPRGRITEVVGPPSSGRTALCLASVASVTAGGEVAAWIDPSSALDARAVEGAGVLLPQLLWVRPRTLSIAWTAADVILRTGGFALIVVDVGEGPRPARPSPSRGPEGAAPREEEESRVVPLSEARVQRPKRAASERVADGVWARLQRGAEQSGAAVVLLSEKHLAGTFAAVTLAMASLARVRRGTSASRSVLVGTLARARIERSKLGTPEREIVVGFGASAVEAGAASEGAGHRFSPGSARPSPALAAARSRQSGARGAK